MSEKELIAKVKELRRIKPNKEWVVLTKSQILGEEKKIKLGSFLLNQPRMLIKLPLMPNEILIKSGRVLRIFFLKPFLKPVYTSLLVLFILFGLFGISQNSLPGDLLYPIKKLTEKSQAVFIPEEEKPQVSLELADRRLDELAKIAQTDQVKKLAPAIDEFQESLSEVTRNLSRIDATSTDVATIKKVVDKVKKLEEKAKEVKAMGVVIGREELEELEGARHIKELEILVNVLKNLITDLENRTLTQEKEQLLIQMKELVEQGNYSKALELYFISQ